MVGYREKKGEDFSYKVCWEEREVSDLGALFGPYSDKKDIKIGGNEKKIESEKFKLYSYESGEVIKSDVVV